MGAVPAQDKAAAESRSSALPISLLFFGFIYTGLVTILLGPLLPVLSSWWSLTDSGAGLLFTLQFCGSTVATLVSTYLNRRFGCGMTIAIGYAWIALGIAGMISLQSPAAQFSVAILGFGLGFVIPTTNLVVTDFWMQKSASALNLLNFFWSIGAISCPVLMAFVIRHESLKPALWLCVAGAVLLAIAVAAVVQDRNPTSGLGTPRRPSENPDRRFLAILAVCFFLYLGSESSIAGWIATYAKRNSQAAIMDWMAAPSVFWVAILVGRGTVSVLVRRIDQFTMLIGGLTISTVGSAILLFAHSLHGILLGSLLAGLGMAGAYPILIALLSERVPSSSRYVGVTFAVGGVGGACLPWAVGLISTHEASLGAGLRLALTSVTFLLFLSVVLSKLNRRLPA